MLHKTCVDLRCAGTSKAVSPSPKRTGKSVKNTGSPWCSLKAFVPVGSSGHLLTGQQGSYSSGQPAVKQILMSKKPFLRPPRCERNTVHWSLAHQTCLKVSNSLTAPTCRSRARAHRRSKPRSRRRRCLARQRDLPRRPRFGTLAPQRSATRTDLSRSDI